MRKGLPKSDDWCNTCEYFVQHYIWSYNRYVETDTGHCVHGKRLRSRRGSDLACDHWTAQTEEYKQRREPLYHDQPQPVPEQEFCFRVQVFKEP